MKNKFLIIFIAIIIIITAIILICINTVNNKTEDVIAPPEENTAFINTWYNPYKYITLDNISINDTNIDISGLSTTFSSEMNIDTITSSQSDNYLGDIKYYDSFSEYDAKLFFKDDNYYVIYQLDDNTTTYNTYKLSNCYSTFYMREDCNTCCYFPCPVFMTLEYASLEIFFKDGDNMLDSLFRNYTYEEAKNFYSKYTGYIAATDDTNKTISVSAFNPTTKEIIRHYIQLNFSNRTISWKTLDGKILSINGHENYGISENY